MKPYLKPLQPVFLAVLLTIMPVPARAGSPENLPFQTPHLPDQVYESHRARPADTLATKRLWVRPSPGPGHRLQLMLHDPPDVPLLVTIQDRLGFTLYQQWHRPDQLLTVHLEDNVRSLPAGMYSAIVSTPQLFLKEKFIVE